ncbi:hypothetical protein G6F42_020856 [Rhizopus arrhizus]|nr:hypothetical protein G6F42_020856 [Rhizopus arrhizus]
MVERINIADSWQDDLERMSLHDTLSRKASQQDQHQFQHRLDQREDQKDDLCPNYESPVTLRYRDSIMPWDLHL